MYNSKLYKFFIMIIWLASYPKSGNTWVRSIVSSLLYTTDGIFDFELLKKIEQFPEKKYFKNFISDFGNFDQIKSNWIPAQDKINLDGKIKLFKTHQGKYMVGKNHFTNEENTKAVIYIVRDPRNVINSISNHYTLSIEKSFEFLKSPSIIGNKKTLEESFKENKSGLLTLLGRWNDHYRSWTRKKNNLLIIKYEDLILNPMLELNRIISFLKNYIKFETDEIKNRNILESTSFENLKKMESEDLFREGVLNKDTNSKVNFFNLGPKNQWQKKLDNKIRDKIEKSFLDELKELNYL